LIALCGFAVAASADTLAVNGTAAMVGSFGLEVSHDATTGAYVEDRTPDNETTYRAEFLLDPNSLGTAGAGGGYRIPVFNVIGPNPNPGVGLCGTSVFKQAASVIMVKDAADNFFVQILGNGNQCGAASGIPRKLPITDGPNKICVEVVMNNGTNGSIAVAAVASGASCPSSGDAAYSDRNLFNPNARADRVRMGTLQPTGSGASSPGSVYFDEFASFRTLAP
jgi:hypothetical protein